LASQAYCLMDAFARDGGEAAGHTGAAVFSAEIAPIGDVSVVARSDQAPAPVSEPAAPSSPTVAATTGELADSAEKPAVHTAPVVAQAQPKVRTAVVMPHAASRHASKPIAASPATTEPATAPYVAPVVERPIAVAQRNITTGGCSGGRWSQPDAAGVPVLVCN
jgi:glutamate/tyrosine decarboxylase-like PLP-dependent enzyme